MTTPRARLPLLALLSATTAMATLQMNCVGDEPPPSFDSPAIDGSSVDGDTSDAQATDAGATDALLDASIDAPPLPREAGTITASGFIVTSSAIGTNCVELGIGVEATYMLCAASSMDCCFNVGNSDCVPTNTASCGVRFACDGPEDCAPGSNCRATGQGGNTACAAGFQSGDRCHETSQCPNGFICCQAKSRREDDAGYEDPPTPGDSRYAAYTNGVCLEATSSLDAWRCDP